VKNSGDTVANRTRDLPAFSVVPQSNGPPVPPPTLYRTIIFPVVLYGSEIYPVTFREEHRLRLFENRVLR